MLFIKLWTGHHGYFNLSNIENSQISWHTERIAAHKFANGKLAEGLYEQRFKWLKGRLAEICHFYVSPSKN